jgi:hypothetical protein
MFRCEKCSATFASQKLYNEHMRESSHMSLILPGLYVGASWNAENRNELKCARIKMMISMAKEIPTAKSPCSHFCHFGLEDSHYEFVIPSLIFATSLIHWGMETGIQTLVHCAIGRSRSVTAVVAYVMYAKNMSSKQALKFVQQRRPGASPNVGYLKQLDILESLLQHFVHSNNQNLNVLHCIAEYLSLPCNCRLCVD